MFHKVIKSSLVLLSVAMVSWIGYGVFRYITHAEKPMITITGIEDNGYYQGLVECSINGENNYKVATIKLALDGKPFEPLTNDKLAIPHKINAKKFSLPFVINTKELSKGKHILEAFVTDASYRANANHFSWEIHIDNTPLKALFLQQEYKIEQGKTAHLKINASKEIKKANIIFSEKMYSFFPAHKDSNLYECFIPIDCEQGACDTILNAHLEDAVGNKLTVSTNFSIVEFAFKKQKGFQVSTEKVESEREVSVSNKVLHDAMEKWLEKTPTEKLWAGPFIMPMEVKRISTPHGEIRMTPTRGRYMHKGIDLVNVPRNVVWASQNGKVIIKERYDITGNTVVLDHGRGIFTKYCHLDSFTDIEVGDVIKKGNPIGRVGITGYASGYHLHWELLVNNVSVDPLEWTTHIH